MKLIGTFEETFKTKKGFNIIPIIVAYIKDRRLLGDDVLRVSILKLGGCPRCIMVKAMDSGIVVCEFELKSRYYVHFRTNTLGKGMNPLILPAMG